MYVNIPVGESADFDLIISWPEAKNGKSYTSPDYAGKKDLVRITVTVEQID